MYDNTETLRIIMTKINNENNLFNQVLYNLPIFVKNIYFGRDFDQPIYIYICLD